LYFSKSFLKILQNDSGIFVKGSDLTFRTPEYIGWSNLRLSISTSSNSVSILFYVIFHNQNYYLQLIQHHVLKAVDLH
ncbi:7682_t:CDS:1, partial [Funneliformis geosporum]